MPVDAATFKRDDERYSIENEIIQFLYHDRDRAYHIRDVIVEVTGTGLSEANIESRDFKEYVGCFLNLAMISSILDELVDDERMERRILDIARGERSYYQAP